MDVKRGEETRKLQITGGSTYIISLPKRWITQNQLKKGGSIRLREEEGGLLSIIPSDVVGREKSEEAFIKVSPRDSPGALIRKTVATYLVGYNMIHITVEKQQQLTARQRNDVKVFAHRMLVGTEIVTDTPAELTLQVLLSYPELSVQSALRRMWIITSSMHKDAITALKDCDHQLARSVVATDDEVDRFSLYVIRQLKTAVQNPRIIKEIGLTSARDCLGYRLITKSVERAADHAVSIAENVLLLKKRPNQEILRKMVEMSSMSISMFETSMEALFKQDFNLAEGLIEKSKDIASLEKEAVSCSQQAGPEESANMRLIIESLRRTAEYASDIAEIVLNLTVESIIG
jgi:phosphate uptake regulator